MKKTTLLLTALLSSSAMANMPVAKLDAEMSQWLACQQPSFNKAATAVNAYRAYGLLPNKPVSELTRPIRVFGERISAVTLSYDADDGSIAWSYQSAMQPHQLAHLMKLGVVAYTPAGTKDVEYRDFNHNQSITLLTRNKGTEVRCQYDMGMF